jgi:cytochrome c-type biogenesis protein CcmE
MSRKAQRAVQIGVTTLVLAVAFGALFYVSLRENMQFYKYLDEVVAEPEAWEGKPLQVHGYVVPGTIGKKRETLEYKFDMQRNGKRLTAYYTGNTPDAFKDDAEVVLTGELQSDGTFVATKMDAKCPSKYEEAPIASTAR